MQSSMRYVQARRRSEIRIDRRVMSLTAIAAYTVGLWTHLAHFRAGEREQQQISFVAHWLRDSTLSLGLVLAAVLLATVLVDGRGGHRLWIATCGTTIAAAIAIGVPFHGRMFGRAHDEHVAAPGLPGLPSLQKSMLAEFLLDLPVALAVVALMLAAAAAAPYLRFTRRTERTIPPIAMLMLLGVIVVPNAATAAPVPSVCPADAPVRTYDVRMIDVRITLNRYGDNDPLGKMYALASEIPAIRAQEASREVSLGLRDDPIQPLVIRANEGDCVEITLTNNASGGRYGIHIDGLPYDRAGDKVGVNVSGELGSNASGTYRYYVPDDSALEGAHYLSPGAGHRAAIDHGLFGVLAVEPKGSQWLSPATLQPIRSGWEAVIAPPDAPSFRENVKILHEIGNEDEKVFDRNGRELPVVDPITEAYRPGGRALNYRAEPFMDRLNAEPHEKAHAYSSTMFGDPATIIPQGYVGDPTKFRVVHGGAEVFHVYHLHGGGDRWRLNPEADNTNSYADVGLRKHPVETSLSDRVDAVNTGPGEHFNAEIEGGAGGTQQAAGDFLFHCHIAEHYPSGMWGLWRVFDTLQSGLAPLPDRAGPPVAVSSAELIGTTMPDGTVLTAANLHEWIDPQLPPVGSPIGSQDASVWDWTVDSSSGDPVYLGEPGPATAQTPNFTSGVSGHPGSRPDDRFVGSRPMILFNPINGRPAFPMLRPRLDRRPPFTANLHSGTPYLGDTADRVPDGSTVDPWVSRPDGLCPADSPVKTFNVVAVPVAVDVTSRLSDPLGVLFTLAQDKAALQAGTRRKEPLAIRANVGDCVAITLTSEETDEGTFGGFAKVEMHIHHVQFDPQGSDGTSAGFNFEHSIRPYTIEDTRLAASTTPGDTSVRVNRLDPKYRVGVAFGVGLATEAIETATITGVDPLSNTITLDRPLEQPHAAGAGAGVEFVRYRWYADALLDNIFWHDHVDGIHGWGHGGVGMFIVEPRGSTYHDPTTGAEVRSGTVVDIHTRNPLAPGLVEGDFREMVIWTLDDNPVTDSTFNLHAAPFADRGLDPSMRFSSWMWGDPGTPLLRAYPGDPVVIRDIHVGPSIDSFRVDGHQFYLEKRSRGSDGRMYSRVTDTIYGGVSERYTLILDGGAGGPAQRPGDYLYHNGVARRFRQGAWGIMRVLPGRVAGLQPLTDHPAPSTTYALPTPTGTRPPPTTNPGNPCPAGAPQKSFAISAVNLPSSNASSGSGRGIRAAYVLSANAAAARKRGVAEPLVMHVNAGDCIVVTFKNERDVRASFSAGELAKSASSSGINVGYTTEQTVAPGRTQVFRLWADEPSIEAAVFTDYGGEDSAKVGLYGAIVVAERGATFTDAKTGAAVTTGAIVDVHVPGLPGYRDVTLMLQDDDVKIGGDFMPYPKDVSGTTVINYRNGGTRTNDFGGTPATPLIQAYVGDPVKIHVISTPGSEQSHVFRAGGLSWPRDPYMPGAQEIAAQGIAPYAGIDVHIIGGAGGRGQQVGDFFYGDNRRPFTEGGMWGLIRVLPAPSCSATTPIRRLDMAVCV